MAEGFARYYGREVLAAHSAGSFASRVHPRAIAVMKEKGVDISGQESKELDEKLLRQMDFVITLCVDAEEICPIAHTGPKRIHWPVKDPVGTVGTEEEIMREFRRARDEIEKKIMNFVNEIKSSVTL